MELPINTKIYEDDNSYSVIGVIKKDIINDIQFDSEEDRLLCDDIINSIEKFASENIMNNKAVSLPGIGCLRRSIYRQAVLIDGKKLSDMRKHMNNTEYKEYTKDYFRGIKEREIEHNKLIIREKKIMKVFKKKYDRYVRVINKSYADMFILAVSNFIGIDYDEELNEHLMKLLNGSN